MKISQGINKENICIMKIKTTQEKEKICSVV